MRRVLLEEMTLTSRTELLLFLADRSGHLDSEVLPALKRGQWVVCERYTDSTLAYQSWGRGIAAEAIDGFLNWCRFPAPDITFLLDVDEKTARSRLVPRTNPDRIESEFKRDLMTRVIQGYRELARRNPQRVVVVDATSDIQHVAERISQHVAERICRHVAERAAKPEEELMEKIEKLALAGRTVKIG